MWFLVWTIIVRTDAQFTINEYRLHIPLTAEACGDALVQKERELAEQSVENGAMSFTVWCERSDDA